jgi:hypothetical protein
VILARGVQPSSHHDASQRRGFSSSAVLPSARHRLERVVEAGAGLGADERLRGLLEGVPRGEPLARGDGGGVEARLAEGRADLRDVPALRVAVRAVGLHHLAHQRHQHHVLVGVQLAQFHRRPPARRGRRPGVRRERSKHGDPRP